jgi:hypothetical protein
MTPQKKSTRNSNGRSAHASSNKNGSNHNNNGNGNPSQATTKKRRGRSRPALVVLRTLLLELPLATLFIVLLVAFAFQDLYEDYFVTFLEQAERNDEHLDNEFTYYDRVCTAEDISTRNLSDLMISHHVSDKEAVDIVRKHGAAVVPKLLSEPTMTKLREFVVRRSNTLPEERMLPVSQGHNRLSFTLDATEDPIIAVALQEIASHPRFKPIMEGLLGPDPALSELSPINAYFGCPDQAWHADVKPDGSPLKFARTYVQSYTAFIPLQDTTGLMGATELLPGTHYCGDNDGMEDLCEKYGVQINEAYPDKTWPGGDAAIVSQQAWHRGAAHGDPNAPERVTFVVTFLPRPDLTNHRRQLSRGTYFHMRWNMWGHTFRDMFDAHKSMAKPFSILRCLGLWKPKDRNYGFDFISSSALRMANNEDGACVDDLPVFVEQFVDGVLHIPHWLQGTVTTRRDAWTVYLRETFQKCVDFAIKANAVALAVYIILTIFAALVWRNGGIVATTVLRLLFLYGTLFLLFLLVVKSILNTPFATNIANERILMRFPSPTDELIVKGSVTDGPTTAPEGRDVLVGSRYDARFLRGFDGFLDFHPGNEAFSELVKARAPYFKSYVGLPGVFSEKVLDSVYSLTMARGRFVQQDYRSGDWRVMSGDEGREHTRVALLAEGTKALGVINQEISYLLAEWRFGLKHGTRLAAESQRYLYHWKRKILFPRKDLGGEQIVLSSSVACRRRLPLQSPNASNIKEKVEPKSLSNARWVHFPAQDPSKFDVGSVVFTQPHEESFWYRGVIVKVRHHDDTLYDVEYNDGDVFKALAKHQILPYTALREGSRVWVEWKTSEEVYPATVLRVRPSREIDVLFDDGDEEFSVPYWRYVPDPSIE